MPRIARIELKDFKTFGPRKVVLEFDGGLTAITGPNGSGKSNLVDAIAFALGELSPSRLRTKSLSDLIRKGAKKAMVKLVLDNSDGALPVASDTVSISRILRPDGESTYRLNNRRISRSELLRLLAAAGIGPSGPNIVFQGKVIELASLGPRELRGLIEERLGLKSYEEEVAEAEEKLRRAELAIREARAKASEISERLRELEAEMNDLRRYELINRELKALRALELLSELKELARQVRSHWKQLRALEERLSELRAEETSLKERLATGDMAELDELTKRISNLKFELGGAEALLRSKEKRLAYLGRREEELKAQLKRALEEAEELRARLSSLAEEKKRLKEAISEARQHRSRFNRRETREAISRCLALVSEALRLVGSLLSSRQPLGWRELAGELGRLQELLDKAQGTLSSLLSAMEKPRTTGKKLARLYKRLGALEAEEKLRLEALRALEREAINSIRRELSSLAQERGLLSEELEELRARVTSLRAELGALEERVKALREERAELLRARERLRIIQEELSRLREERARLTAELPMLLRRVRSLASDLKGLCQDEHVLRALREPLEPEVAQWARELLARELEAMGPVNQLAAEHYEREIERYSELAARLAKLSEEKKAILDFMAEVEARKKQELERALEELSSRISLFFSKLTGGGRAWLSLQDPSDPLSSGVELMVEFPGKGPISLRGASGGERSVASLALLFALQALTPSPFYVLDEVDAHLDQEHVGRFAELLRELAGQAQLIVITLRPDVAAAADRVYGLYYSGGTHIVRLERGPGGWRTA